jgi:hypothetical protein
MSRVNVGNLTVDETIEVVKDGIEMLTDNDVIEIVVAWCRGDQVRLDELFAEIEVL